MLHKKGKQQKYTIVRDSKLSEQIYAKTLNNNPETASGKTTAAHLLSRTSWWSRVACHQVQPVDLLKLQLIYKSQRSDAPE